MAYSTKLQAGSQLLTKSSWDPGRLTSARRVAARDQLPQKRHTAHLRDGASATHPGNSWLQGTLIDKSSSKSLHTYIETSSIQEPTSLRSKFSNYAGTLPWAQKYRWPKVTPNPQTPQNSLLDTSLHSREKRSSSIHQNTNASSPNQETLTSYSSNPTHREEPPQ